MDMIKVAVCDDLKSVREDICNEIKKQKTGEKCTADAFQSGEEVLKAMEEEYYDIYFLDIELAEGGMDGYQLAQEIRRREPAVVLIFLSSHDEYACEAFEVGALRFLRKPVVEQKFAEAFGKAVDMVLAGNEDFVYKQEKVLRKVKIKEILYFAVEGKELTIKLVDGEERKFKGSLKEVAEKLRYHYFAQSYKSLYVQLEYVSYIGKTEIELSNGEKLPLSRKYKKAFREANAEFIWRREEK